MMNDWTDIIGKQLGSLNEPLPADDWNVIQQKYSTRQRARRAAAWRWTSSIAATAAAVLLIFFFCPLQALHLQAFLMPVYNCRDQECSCRE